MCTLIFKARLLNYTLAGSSGLDTNNFSLSPVTATVKFDAADADQHFQLVDGKLRRVDAEIFAQLEPATTAAGVAESPVLPARVRGAS